MAEQPRGSNDPLTVSAYHAKAGTDHMYRVEDGWLSNPLRVEVPGE